MLAGPVLETSQSHSAGHSRSVPRSPPGFPPCMGAGRHRIVAIATPSHESDLDAQQYLAGHSGYSFPLDHRSDASPSVASSLSSTDLRFLVSSSALSPIPCLGGWGPGLLFRSSAHREKAISEMQQMDAVLDLVLFDLMSSGSNSTYAQKAQLVTLKWREFVSNGGATALWALLCLSETPPPYTLCATWLLQAIAAAQNLQPSDLVRHLDTLHLVVQNFETVRGTFPLAFLHQPLFIFVLTTLEKSGHPTMVALVQDWRRQCGSGWMWICSLRWGQILLRFVLRMLSLMMFRSFIGFTDPCACRCSCSAEDSGLYYFPTLIRLLQNSYRQPCAALSTAW